MRPFLGGLHAGVISTDRRNDVEQKLGVKPYYSVTLKDSAFRAKYELPPLHFDFVFAPNNGPVEGLTVYSLVEK
jgi:hypothetical protein